MGRWLIALIGAILPILAGAAVSVDRAIEPPQGWSLAQVLALPESAWTRLPSPEINAGYVDRVHWFRLRIDAPDAPTTGHLNLGNPLLDRVTIHVVRGPGQGRSVVLGAHQPFHDRPVLATAFRWPLTLQPGSPTELLLRVQTATSMQLKFSVETERAFQSDERQFLVTNGLLFGVMLAMAAYNLCLFASTRDLTYLWYIGWVACMGLFSASVVGAAYEWLWPGLPRWNMLSRPVLLSLAVASAMLFARGFIGPDSLHRATRWALAALGLVALACAAASPVMPYQLAIKSAITIAVLAMVVTPLGAFVAWRAGSAPAGYYLFAWGFVVLGGMLLAADKLGLVPSSVLTQHASQIGAAIESVVLSFALAARLNAERRMRERAQHDAERSREEARRLGDLSLRDALTGLYNRRRLDEHLNALSRDPRLAGQGLAVMMVDIDHFKHLNDSHGHAAGDACICAVGRLLQAQSRQDADLAARYGGEEFCVLLTAADAPQAQRFAERLRAGVEALRIDHGGAVLQLSVSIGIAVRPAGDRRDPHELLRLADEALYRAKAGGRNRCVLHPGPVVDPRPPEARPQAALEA